MKRVTIAMVAMGCLGLLTSCGNGPNDETPSGGRTTASASPVPAIFAKARAAREDGSVALCGFYVGMDKSDAAALVKHYRLKDDEYAVVGNPVWSIRFSLKGIRRITNGGNTEKELFQAVANQVGDFKGSRGAYCHETIDGYIVTMGRSGIEMKKSDDAIKNRARENTVAKSSSKDVQTLLASMVRISEKNFLMGRFEVTQAQWASVMGNNPSWFPDADHPVEHVSRDDCQEFLKKLNASPEAKKSGLMFRLPTEEEWEYACRAGAKGDYCRLADGTEITSETLGEVAWFEDNSCDETHPVGQKKPNAFGLYDMQGNVCEWTSTAGGEGLVGRGGRWDDSAWICKSSSRYWVSPAYRIYNFGFRLCASGRAD